MLRAKDIFPRAIWARAPQVLHPCDIVFVGFVCDTHDMEMGFLHCRKSKAEQGQCDAEIRFKLVQSD